MKTKSGELEELKEGKTIFSYFNEDTSKKRDALFSRENYQSHFDGKQGIYKFTVNAVVGKFTFNCLVLNSYTFIV